MKWLKNFLEWPKEGVTNISDLGNYVKSNWLKLIILIIVLFVLIFLLYWLVKLIKSLFRK